MGEQSERFAELALPLFDSLYNFACWLARDRAEAEDLVQETYAKALRGFSGFAPGTNFRAWMFRILRNTFLNSRTGAAARAVSLDDDPEAAAPALVTNQTPEAIFLRQAAQEEVRQALENLPLPFREVLLLADAEDMAYREIAEALGIPQGTVMSRLSRARALLRSALRETVART